MRSRDIETLVDLVSASEIAEITLRSGDRRVTIRKADTGAAASAQKSAIVHPVIIGEGHPFAESQEVTTAADFVNEIIRSPMVGIFHHAEPPLGIGSRVDAGAVVGFIESMKLMNEVVSEVSGVVEQIEVEAGIAVEYGQPMFVIGRGQSS